MLPHPTTQAESDALDRKGADFIQAVQVAFADRIGSMPIKATSVGSCPVFYVGDQYVAKLYSPLYREGFRTEAEALQLLDGSRDLPTPKLVEAKEVEGWSAVLMTRVDGTCLKDLWPGLASEQKEKLCQSIGKMTRALHNVDPGRSCASSWNWASFLDTQIRGCEERQRRRGLREQLTQQIPGFLESLNLDATGAHVFLHTEIMLDHVFARDAGDGLQLTGLIDFEPAMVGCAEYEFASIGLFVAQGNERLLRAFLSGYGHAIDSDLHRRLMGYALLHRYSRLSWYLEFMPAGDSLEELAEKWFGTG